MGRQRNRPQMKAEISLEDELDEMEIRTLSDSLE